MARFFKSALLFLCLLTVSCQEGGDAGDLLGQWRMSGTDKYYVSFSGSVTLLRCPGENEVFGKFQHIGDSLFIQCTSIYGSPADTALVEERFGLKPFTNIRVRIDALDGERLEMSKDNQKWNFRKY